MVAACVSGCLSHAWKFHPDPRVTHFRERLRQYLAGPLAQGGWGFVLFSHEDSRPGKLPARTLAVVTLGESVSLTNRMVQTLPPLWLEGDAGLFRLLPLSIEPETMDEPAPGAALRRGEDIASGPTLTILPSHLLAGGLIFISDQPTPPNGWPW